MIEWLGSSLSHAPDAAEAEMASRGVDRLGVARGGPVAAAIIRRTEMRAALYDLARDFDPRLAGIVAFLLARAARVDRQAARPLLRGGSGLPVGGPIPT